MMAEGDYRICLTERCEDPERETVASVRRWKFDPAVPGVMEIVVPARVRAKMHRRTRRRIARAMAAEGAHPGMRIVVLTREEYAEREKAGVG